MSNSGDEPVRLSATELHRQTGAALREVRHGRVVEVVDRYGDAQALLVPPERAVAASA